MIKKFPETVHVTILWFNYFRIKKHVLSNPFWYFVFFCSFFLLLLLF